MSQILSGIRVIDLTMWWAGPFVTQLLGDMGAEIIKIESIQVADGWRFTNPKADHDKPWELSSYFNGVNRNKHGITLNLQDPRGIELCKRLVAIGDVVVENYTPRVMENFGLDYPKLCEIKSDIIMLSLSGYGGTGPWRDYAAFAFPVEDMSGFPQMTGYEDDDTPRRWGNSGVDAISGLTGAYAVLTALEHRRRTGEGQRIDLSMVEALTSFLGGPILDYQVNTRLPQRQGNHHPAHAPHSMYPCKGEDTWVSIAATSEEEWRALCTTMGRLDWLTDTRFADPVARHTHQAVLDEAIGEWTQQYERMEVMQTLQTAGVPAMPVLSSADVLNDPHMKARDYFQRTTRAEVGPHAHGLHWAHFSDTPLSLRRPAPLLGEHNEFVLKELLGLSDAELSDLERDEVIGTTFVGAARL